MNRLDNDFSFDHGPLVLPAPVPEGPVCREPECTRGPYPVPGDEADFTGLCKAHRDQAIHSTQSRRARGEAA